MERGGYVYILTNINHSVLYIGVTSNLRDRILEHKAKIYPTIYSKIQLYHFNLFRIL